MRTLTPQGFYPTMTTVRLAVTLPESIWVAAATTAHPTTSIAALAALAREDAGFGIARVYGDQVDEMLDTIAAHESVLELEVIHTSNGEALIEFVTDQPMLVVTAQQSGIPIEFPVTITDGTAELDITGSRDRLNQLLDQLHGLGLEFDVKYVREYQDPSNLLSDRQQEVVLAAVERGYYDSPRRCTLTDLAEELEIAKSTCSDILHRAESQIVREFIESLPADQAPPDRRW